METCREFNLTSTGAVAEHEQIYSLIDVTGRYARMDSLVNNRVSYHNKERNTYLYWHFYGFWVVMKWIKEYSFSKLL